MRERRMVSGESAGDPAGSARTGTMSTDYSSTCSVIRRRTTAAIHSASVTATTASACTTQRYHRDLPDKPDADYRAFLHDATVTMSETIRQIIRDKRPNAALVGTSPEIGDIVFSESNTAVKRPLPLWPYASSDNVSRARNTYPEKMAVNQCMSFIDYAWRFAMVPSAGDSYAPMAERRQRWRCRHQRPRHVGAGGPYCA